MAKNKDKTITDLDYLREMLSLKMYMFVKWYLDGAKEEEYPQLQKNLCIEKDSKWAKENYLKRQDVQKAIVELTRLNKDFNLAEIYNTMYKKALEGDVNCANWIVKFSESSFFEQKKNKIQELMEGVSLDE